jgi:hypothetical protein
MGPKKKSPPKLKTVLKCDNIFLQEKVFNFPQEFGQFLTVYLFYKNVMLQQLCENLSPKNSLELLIVQNEFT